MILTQKLQLVQQGELVLQAAATAAGVAEAVSELVPSGFIWQLDRILISTTSAASTRFELYNRGQRGSTSVGERVEFSNSGNDDVGEFTALRITEGNIVRARWTGATANALCTIHALYSVYRIQYVTESGQVDNTGGEGVTRTERAERADRVVSSQQRFVEPGRPSRPPPGRRNV